MTLKLVVNNSKKTDQPFLGGEALRNELEKRPTVQSREALVLENLKKIGFDPYEDIVA